MKLLTKKQMTMLSEFEKHFHTVIYAKYKRMTSTRANDIVADIYEEATGEVVKRTWSCAKCVYALYEKCGRLYYLTKEANGEEKQEPKKKKAGRPKKNKTKTTNKDAEGKV